MTNVQKRKLFCWPLFTLLLGGCSTFYGYPADYQDKAAVLNVSAPYLDPSVLAQQYSPPPTLGLTAEQYRNVVVWSRINVIDQNYMSFEETLTSSLDDLSVGTDFTTLALNGLGATLGGVATKAALAAASAGVIGAKSAVNTDVFYQRTLPALITQMRADRKTILATIEQALKEDTNKYPMGEALIDVQNYYVAGTLSGALTEVTAQAGVKLQAAETEETINSVSNSTSVVPASVDTQLAGLTDVQALAAYKTLKPFLATRPEDIQATIKAIFPSGIADTSGAAARALLRQWAALDSFDPSMATKFSAAIKSVHSQ